MHLVLLEFFIFLMIFLLFVLASAVANRKTATEADALNKIAGILKYTPDKIGAGGRGKTGNNDKWDWMFMT